MDLRLKQLSYSSNLTLHSCPRAYQLYKLNAKAAEEDYESSVTFAFGHVIGAGIQGIFQEHSYNQLVMEAFLGWEPDLFASNTKQNKSFFTALSAILKFYSLREHGFLSSYELVYHEGEPAVELGFIIKLPDGFVYRGFVDGVLRHKETGKVIVLECKTTSQSNLHPAMYKNSAQAIGYSIVLDYLFAELSSYDVLYLVYKSKGMEYETMQFAKTYLQRALWIQELLLDVESIQRYEELGVYPMRGESCYNFYRECSYFETCTLSTSLITSPLTPEIEEKIHKDNEEKYVVKVSLEDLIQKQLEKA